MHGGEVAVAFAVLLGLLVGVVPGFWLGARGYERTKGHPWLVAIVAILAIAGLLMYTLNGPSEELFIRLVMLPLSLLIAIASVAVLIGIPMYASYLLGHRMGRWATSDRK